MLKMPFKIILVKVYFRELSFIRVCAGSSFRRAAYV